MVAIKPMLVLCCIVVSGRRIMKHRVQDSSLASSSLQLDASANRTEKPVNTWPQDMTSKGFKLKKALSCGQNGCAFLAATDDGKMKVVKVQDERHMTSRWARTLAVECRQMRWMRYQACGKGAELLKQHETFIPSCSEFGTTREGLSYLVMPYVGPVQIKKYDRDESLYREMFSEDDQKKLIAQLVTAVASVHALGVWHADLNPGNVMFDGDRLSLIDYGLAVSARCDKKRCLTGYGRDGNSVYRWMTMLADCPGEAQWQSKWWKHTPKEKLAAAQKASLQCIQKKWKPDEDFVRVLGKMFDANVRQHPKQYVQELAATPFVTQNLPELNSIYPLKGTEGCENWSKEELNSNGKTGQIQGVWKY